MNKTYNHKQDSSKSFSTSSSKGCYPSTSANLSTPWITEKSVQSDSYSHWAHEFLPADLHVTHQSEDPWRPQTQKYSHRCSNQPLSSSEKPTSKSVKCESKSQMKAKQRSFSSMPAPSTAKQIFSTAMPELHAAPVTVGSYRSYRDRSHNTVDEPIIGNEATLPLTARSKKTPNFLQKMGLKLKRTVEYIGASNCAFEED